MSDAKECLNILAAKLSDHIFMFENRATLIDAYLYGYLRILSKAPFVNSPLKKHLNACYNLTSLVNRTEKDLFPLVEPKGNILAIIIRL